MACQKCRRLASRLRRVLKKQCGQLNSNYKQPRCAVNLLRPRRVQHVYQHLRLLLVIKRYYARNPIADTDLVLLIVSSDSSITLCAYVIVVLFSATNKIVCLAICPVQDRIEFCNVIFLTMYFCFHMICLENTCHTLICTSSSAVMPNTMTPTSLKPCSHA